MKSVPRCLFNLLATINKNKSRISWYDICWAYLSHWSLNKGYYRYMNCLPFRSIRVHPRLIGVRVTRSLVLYVCFVDRCLFFCTFCFGHCVVCSSSIYGFWLPLWYLQTLYTTYTRLTAYIDLHLEIDSEGR
jgi:hypothetical protein